LQSDDSFIVPGNNTSGLRDLSRDFICIVSCLTDPISLSEGFFVFYLLLGCWVLGNNTSGFGNLSRDFVCIVNIAMDVNIVLYTLA